MMSLTLHTCLLLALSRLTMVKCQSGENFSQVLQDTLTLDARVRPVKNFTTATVVTVSFHLMSIIDFDTVKQKLVSNGWLYVQWINEYTTWNPAEYGGVLMVNPDPDTVWRPRLTIKNTMKDLKPIGEEYITILSRYDGLTMWLPAERYETFCRVDVTYFPFDIQTCQWKMFVWGGDPIQAIDIQPLIPTMDLDTFVPNGEWELRATRGWPEVVFQGGADYAYVFYEITLRRRPSLLALTVLLPVLVLALVNVFVFTIPSESGERLAYSMTALLSFGVFMSFILDSMPSSTETLSIVAVNLSSLLVLSAVYVLLCILSLRLFHRDPVKHPVPSTVQSLIVWLEVLVCLDPPARNKIDVIRTDTTSSNVTGPKHDVGVRNGGLKGKLDKWKMTKEIKRAAYSDPEEMTWRRVSRTLDKLFFRFFFCLVLVSNAVVWGVMGNNYVNSV